MIDINRYKETALKILSPIKPIQKATIAKKDFPFQAQRSDAGRKLPEYYLVYFLFNDLVGFKDSGQFEKVAFSFPIDYKGKAFIVEYRKLGLGVFVQDKNVDEKDAEEIVKKINGAVKSIRPYYDYLAEKAVKDSEFNVVNRNVELYNRYLFLANAYKSEHKKYLKFKGQWRTTVRETKTGEHRSSVALDRKYYEQANWLAISAIEAFYSWTEHLFIHLAIVGQSLSKGEEITKLIDAEWKIKFKAAIPLDTPEAKLFFDELILVRQQLRNFVAHGAFGKDGNAFQFHSGAGAVPVQMSHNKIKNRFSFYGQLHFNNETVVQLIEEFIAFLSEGAISTAMYYTQTRELPTIVPFAADGTFAVAVESMENMVIFANKIATDIDNSLNMDW